jgi:hypothetical protein
LSDSAEAVFSGGEIDLADTAGLTDAVQVVLVRAAYAFDQASITDSVEAVLVVGGTRTDVTVSMSVHTRASMSPRTSRIALDPKAGNAVLNPHIT